MIKTTMISKMIAKTLATTLTMTTTLALATTLCVAVGCGDDGESPSTGDSNATDASTGTDGASSTGGDATDGSSSDASGEGSDASGSSSDAGTTGEPPDPAEVEMCLEQVEEGDACGECGCNNCLAQLQACNDNEGCVAIRDCARENMCTGLACLEVCGDTIDMYGGLAGESAMLALVVSDCIEKQCPGLCS